MLKKILLVVLFSLLSIVVLVFSYYFSYSSELSGYVDELIEQKQYKEVQSFYGSLFENTDLYNFEDANGTVIKINRSISYNIDKSSLEADAEGYYEPYSYYDEAIDIVVFNLEDFNTSEAYADDKELKTAITVTFSDGRTYTKPYVNEFTAAGQYFDKLSYYNNFGFLPVTLFESDIRKSLTLTETDVIPDITGVKITDAAGDVKVEQTGITVAAPFVSPFYSLFDTFMTEYKTYAYNYATKGEADVEERTRLQDNLQKIFDENEETVVYSQFKNSSVTGRTGFIVKIAITVVALVLILALIVYFFMIKPSRDRMKPIVKLEQNK